MPNITLAIPADLKKVMAKYKEARWSEIARRAIEEYANKLHLLDTILAKSELTEEDVQEMSRNVRKGVMEWHERQYRKSQKK